MKKGINQTDLQYLLGLIKDRFYTKDEADQMFQKLSSGVTITLSGSNCTLSNSNIRYRRSFTTNVIRDFGYTVTGIQVTMGGVDITSTSVSNNTVTIPKVLDNVVIIATTSQILTSNLNGVQYSNFDLDIGQAWSTSLVAESGKTLLPNTVKVMMGSVDITEGSFNFELGSIEINNVTDALEISAKSIIMPEGYTPIQYIRNTNLAYNSTKYRYFDTGYHPTNLTVVEHDFNFLAQSNNSGLMGAGGYDGTPFFAVGCSYSDLERGRIAWGNKEYTTSDFTVARNLRQIVTFGKGTLTCKNISNVTQTKTIASTLATPWTSSKTFTIGGFQQSANIYRVGPLKLYGCKIYEDTQLQQDWVPFVRNSDNYVGFYDIKNDIFITEKTTSNTDRCDWIRPYVGVTRTLTNCTQSMLTGLLASGNASMAIIGETWSCKFAPIGNCTFDSQDAIFQVMINGVDKTNDYATYNSSDDSWTVSLIPHWKDAISINSTPAGIIELAFIGNSWTDSSRVERAIALEIQSSSKGFYTIQNGSAVAYSLPDNTIVKYDGIYYKTLSNRYLIPQQGAQDLGVTWETNGYVLSSGVMSTVTDSDFKHCSISAHAGETYYFVLFGAGSITEIIKEVNGVYTSEYNTSTTYGFYKKLAITEDCTLYLSHYPQTNAYIHPVVAIGT